MFNIFTWLGDLFFGVNTPKAPRPSKNILPLLGNIDELCEELLKIHNNIRICYNLNSLILLPKLSISAQRQASWMARNRNMEHTWPDGTTFGDRVKAAGYKLKAGGENIAAGYTNTQEVMLAWLKSKGHEQNILNPMFTNVGFGVSQDANGHNYWCADFAVPLSFRIVKFHVDVSVFIPPAIVQQP